MRLYCVTARVVGFTCLAVALWAAHSFGAEAVSGVISTLAGSGTAGFSGDGAAATAARMVSPSAVAVDGMGNVYIADAGNNRIRKVAVATGVISTVAGIGYSEGTSTFAGDGGLATAARLSEPNAVAVDGAGNLYIADTGNNRVRKVTAATGVITTVAGSGSDGFGGDGAPATAAQIERPCGVALDGSGNLYIADTENNRVRKVTVATGTITTVAGSGTYGFSGDGAAASAAQMRWPSAVALDGAGNIYIADSNNNRIRKVTVDTGVITTVAGNGASGYDGEAGAATAASLDTPNGVAVDGEGNVLIADTSNDRIRRVSASSGVITTVAGGGTQGFGGDGGAAPAAQLYFPNGVAVDTAGNVYIADTGNDRVRKVINTSAPAFLMTTLAGTGEYGLTGDGAVATAAKMRVPSAVAVDALGNVYVADTNNDRIRKVTAATGLITTVAGNGYGFGGDGGPATMAQLAEPAGIAVRGNGDLYIADTANNRIRKVTVATGTITTVAGSGTFGFGGDGGTATAAELYSPQGVAVDSAGNIYIADTGNDRIRKVTAATGVITTLAGSGTFGFSGDGAAATAAQMRTPSSVALDGAGNVYIADTNNDRIRKVTAATGVITTVAGISYSEGTITFDGEAGPATAARLFQPRGVAVDGVGNLYIADSGNDRIRKVTIATGAINTAAGSGTQGYGGDGGAATAAQIYDPYGVAVDGAGNFYLADTSNNRVRAVMKPLAAPSSFSATATSISQVALSWAAVNDATSYEIWRSTLNGPYILVSSPSGTSENNTGLSSDTTYLYKVRAIRGARASAFTPIDAATTTVFTNSNLSGLLIRAVHINQLRTAVNAMRASTGMAPATFSDATLAAGSAVVRRAHVLELRAALDAARSAIGLPPVAYTDASIVAGGTVIKAMHITQLRAGTQ